MPPLVFPQNDVWEMSAKIPYWWHITTQIWVVLLIGCTAQIICVSQSEAWPRSGKWRIISMVFLRLFLRRHFTGKPLETSQNVGCFLRLLRHHYLVNVCTWIPVLVSTSCCRLQNWKVANYVKLLQITSTCIFHGCHHVACLMSCAQRRGLDPREGW